MPSSRLAFSALSALAFAARLAAQQPGRAATAKWIETEMSAITRHVYDELKLDGQYQSRSMHYARVPEFFMPWEPNCRLEFDIENGYTLIGPGGQTSKTEESRALYIPMRYVDLGSVSVQRIPVAEGWSRNRPVYEVQLRVRPEARIRVVVPGKEDFEQWNSAAIPVADEQSGERVVRALKRAATLCGASASAF
jgi:hypothetical protein